jgi:predicted NBD/HSP70 family sugar kinase
MIDVQHIVAGDLGGTESRSAIVDYEGDEAHLLEETYRKWKSEHQDDLRTVLLNGIGNTIRDFRKQIAGVALAIAGPVEDHQTVLSAANTHCRHNLTPFDLHAYLEETFHTSSIVANDLEAAAAGEREKGALQGLQWGMLENLGTGWGGARIFNGVAVAAEPGHMWLPGNDAKCGCGKKDCAEATLSGGAIERRIREECATKDITIPEGMAPCAFADREAIAGKTWAVELYTNVARGIGNIWGSDLNNCPPIERIVYMGSFLERAMEIEFFRQQVRAAMIERSMFFKQHQKVEIVGLGAPRLATGEPLGPLYGAANIWKRLHDKHARA